MKNIVLVVFCFFLFAACHDSQSTNLDSSSVPSLEDSSNTPPTPPSLN